MHRRDFMGAAVGAGLLCSTGALFGERAFAQSPGVLRRSRGGNLTSLDPQRSISATDMEIVADFFVGVTAIDARGEIIPGCAADWKISADGKRYEFRLRPGISWSDGRQLTAGDVVFSLQRLLTPSTAALLAYRYDAIRGARAVREGKATPATLGVRAIAADRVVFELERPETDLLKLLSVAYLVPAHAVTAAGRDWAKPPSIVVNGPWRPVSWAQSGTLVLEANPRWFGARSTVMVPRLEWVMGIDDAARLRAFRSGELDVAQIGEPAQYALAKKEAGPRLRSVPFYGGGWIGLNLRRPLLRDPRFREMLALAIDRQVLTDKVRGLGERPTESLVPEAVRDYSRRASSPFAALGSAQRLAAARERAAALGLSRARPAKLELIYSMNPLTQRTFLAIDAMWAPFGVRIEARGLESRAYSLALNAGDFDLMDYGPFSAVQSATSFVGRFQSGSFLNYSGYSNAEVDRLIALAESQIDPQRRAQHYREVETILLRELPVIPLYSGMAHRLVAPHVLGWVDNPGLALPSQYLTLRS